MTGIFHAVLNMSVTAAVVIAAIALIRLPLSKAPKAITCGLWFVALFRLLCPVSFRSAVSLFSLRGTPSMTYIQPSFQTIPAPAVSAADLSAAPVTAGPVITAVMPGTVKTAGSSVTVLSVLAIVWAAVAAALLLYGIVSYIRLRRRIGTATRADGNIYETDRVVSPFVAGFFRPAIYLPVGLSGGVRTLIIEHEKTHISRRDYLTKLLWYLAVCIHWFNPLVWGAFYLVGKDMEMRCDEVVVRKLGDAVKADYSDALLALSAPRTFFAANPLAFGEGSLLSRIKKVLNFKRPVTWVVAAALAAAVALTVVLAANPMASAAAPNASGPSVPASSDLGQTAPPAASAAASEPGHTIACRLYRLGKNRIPIACVNPLTEEQEIAIVSKAANRLFSGSNALQPVDISTLSECYLISGSTTDDNCPNFYIFMQDGNASIQAGKSGYRTALENELYSTIKALMDSTINRSALEIEKNLTAIMSSPATSSNPGDYIKAHQIEYNSILKMGDSALSYMLSCFNSGEGNSLKGYIMTFLCSDLLGTRSSLDNQNLFPADWFAKLDLWGEIQLPDYVYAEGDPLTKAVYETETEKDRGSDGGFTVVSVHEFGRYEEGDRVKVVAMVLSLNCHLYGQYLQPYSLSYYPRAFTFTQNQDGTYGLTEYQTYEIGVDYDTTVKNFCTMPVSGKTIPGLAEQFLAYTPDPHSSLMAQLRKNTEELFQQNGIAGVNLPFYMTESTRE